MRILDLLSPKSVDLNFNAHSKPEAIDTLVDLMFSTGNITDKAEYKKEILAREALSTTGIGEGIAIPHAKTKAVKKATLVSGVSKEGIDYEALDGQPSHLFFMIAAPDGANNTHLEVLARLSQILMDGKFRESLINAKTPEEFLALIDQKETEKFGAETSDTKEEAKPAPTSKGGYQVLAVTACPTGIAHTYMAAEALQNKADELGITCKVETNGSGGAKNILTKDDIENCTAIIVAADKNVEMARFDGKKVIITKVADGIHKAEELVKRAAAGDAPIYHASSHGGSSESSDAGSGEGLGRSIYKHLMNGVSHMLPFVIGGGLLKAIAFLVDSLAGYTDALGSNTAAAMWFNNIGGAAFDFMLPVLAGYIAMSIGERPALAMGIVGGYLAGMGGSGFLGALVAGFAAGYLFILLRNLCDKLPAALEGLKPTLIYPLVGIALIGAAITWIINPPVAWVNNIMTNALLSMGQGSAVIAGIILAGMMAIDMGGPFNKAAYVTGIAALEAGNLVLMACVMIGGMVPPLAIALCSTFFPNRFTKKERESGLVNYIMGLSFITEGAIPFAAADPGRVIPACVVGSACAGALSAWFGCTLNAPHGGIFVLPTIGHPLYYAIALAVGSVIGCILLAVFKKPIQEKK